MKITTNAFINLVSRSGVLLLIWWLLTDGNASSWWIGIPAIVFAVVASLILLPPVHLVWYECVRFIPFFLIRSLIGGTDVAWRAFHPRMPIDPELIEYSLRLPPGLPQVFMSNTMNLLPGTLSVSLERSTMKMHVLDSQKNVLAELQVVEQNVARLFGISLKTPLRDE